MNSIRSSSLFGVDGMVFVITGGGSGLGEMMALALDANGARKVFILGRREASLEKVAAKATNKSVVSVVCDVSSKDALQAAVAAIERQTPFLNAVVANSGALGPATAFRPADSTFESIQQILWNASLEETRDMLNLNVLGSYFTFVAFMKLLQAGNEHPDSRGKKDFIQSQFIAVTSLAAYSRQENVSYGYMASKAALSHLTKALATSFGPSGIRANAISPGLYITEMTEFVAGGADLSKPGSMPKSQIPMSRTGSFEDMAGAILFLTSRAGAFLNGNIILSDGGSVGNQPSTY